MAQETAMNGEPTDWINAPDDADGTISEKIERANAALDDGQAVVLDVDGVHESRSTVLFHDDEKDILIWSPHVDGRRRVFGYSRDAIGSTALKTKQITIGFADEVRAADLDETPLHHGTYGYKPVEDVV